jgi:hypothetical protein
MIGRQGIEQRNELPDVVAPGLVGPDRLCVACLAWLPDFTDATLVATGTTGAARETVSWCGPDAADLEELQYVVGEGPGQDASATGKPVAVWDLGSGPSLRRWPAFAPEAWQLGIQSLVAVPVLAGGAEVGVLALYARLPSVLTAATLGTAWKLGRTAAGALLRLTGSDLDAAGERSGKTLAYQASGVVAARHGIAVPAAFTLIRAHAYRCRRPLRRLAADILAGRADVFPEQNDC